MESVWRAAGRLPRLFLTGLSLIPRNVRYFAAFGAETDMPGRGQTSARDRQAFMMADTL